MFLSVSLCFIISPLSTKTLYLFVSHGKDAKKDTNKYKTPVNTKNYNATKNPDKSCLSGL